MHKRRSFSRIGLAAAGVLALTLTACAGGNGDATTDNGADNTADAGSSSKLEQLQEAGTITLAVNDERPYSWVEGGEGTGATIALHKEIFANLGIDNVEVVYADWNSLIPGLTAGRFDAISAGMSITPERCEQAAFSDPEIMYTTALLVPEDNPLDLHDLDDVVAMGDDVTLSVLSGGIEQGYAESLGISDPIFVNSAQEGMEIVQSGRADAFAVTAISLNWMVDNANDPGVIVTDPFVQVIDGVEQIGAGSTVFAPGDTDLLEAYNAELAEITADPESYLSFVGEFGFTEDNLPPADLTTAQLCAGDLG